MRKLFGNSGKKECPQKKEHPEKKEHPGKNAIQLDRRYIPYICLVAVGAFFITAGLREIIAGQRETAAARTEYDQLLEDFTEITNQQTPIPYIDSEDYPEDIEEDEEKEEEEEPGPPTLEDLARMNSDFVGWISIKDLIEYPIVRASDNDKYVNLTFTGQRNTAGAIFMDYRHREGFDEKVCILYGHHTWDGTMFAPLAKYLDASFLQRNPTITITMPDGKYMTYRIFAAKLTNAWDEAYAVGTSDAARAADVFPNAPADASRFLLMSTCTRNREKDERILVYAAAT